MKKTIIAAVMAMLAIVPALARDRYTTDHTQLPAAARQVIAETFGQNKINHIKIDTDMYGTSYDVVLNNGTELEFDFDCDCDDCCDDDCCNDGDKE